MFNPAVVSTTTPMSGIYQISFGLTALICFIEMVRVILMMHIMVVEGVDTYEKIIYNCMLSSAVILLILTVRSGITAISGCSSIVHIMAALNIAPILIYVYMLRTASKLMWIKLVCGKYGICPQLFKLRGRIR